MTLPLMLELIAAPIVGEVAPALAPARLTAASPATECPVTVKVIGRAA